MRELKGQNTNFTVTNIAGFKVQNVIYKFFLDNMAISDAAYYLKDATFGVGSVFRDTVVRFCLSFCTVIALSWVAVMMYVSFYYAYMPTVHHSQPVFLEFS